MLILVGVLMILAVSMLMAMSFVQELRGIVLVLAIPVLKTGSLSIGEIIGNGSLLGTVSGWIGIFTAIFVIQGKLNLCPFDIPDAETEIMGGVLAEYSGGLLAVIKMTKAMLLFVLPVFIMTLFGGGIIHFLTVKSVAAGAGKYILILVVLVLIKNTNPRLRIDHAMKFYWYFLAPLALTGLVLAYIGVTYSISWL